MKTRPVLCGDSAPEIPHATGTCYGRVLLRDNTPKLPVPILKQGYDFLPISVSLVDMEASPLHRRQGGQPPHCAELHSTGYWVMQESSQVDAAVPSAASVVGEGVVCSPWFDADVVVGVSVVGEGVVLSPRFDAPSPSPSPTVVVGASVVGEGVVLSPWLDTDVVVGVSVVGEGVVLSPWFDADVVVGASVVGEGVVLTPWQPAWVVDGTDVVCVP